MKTHLHQGWTLRVADTSTAVEIPAPVADAVVPASVPGCVHTDLLAAGLIPDPYLDDNEAALAWIGRTDWHYQTTVDWRPGGHERVDLVCAGLDTVARVDLNGVELGRTRNMHRSYRFDVTDVLRAGGNDLAVRFTSALTHAEQLRDQLGARPHTNRFPFNFVRKMACNFGWDWGPELVTAGIWRPIWLHAWSTARLAEVRPLATVSDGRGRVAVHVTVERTAAGADRPLLVRATVGEHTASAELAPGADTAVVEVSVPDPALWWPTGYGDQPLYPVRVDLTAEGSTVDSWDGQTGFRTVVLDTTPDEHGTPFRFVINGRPVFVRGVNWIPDDCFPHRVDHDRYASRLAQAKDAGANLLRVWGGGIYESEDFYRLCDQLGLLTWQDFLFACAAYPEEEPLRGEVVAEAREAVTRLAPHPSLVLWNGSNENIWGWHDWGWPERLGEASWGLGYYLDVLPGLVAELDPTRPYLPSSPWSLSADIHPNDPDHGCVHVWDVWNERDYTAYRDYVPRFVAEFGFQGPPTWSTLTRAVSDKPLTPDSPGLLVHQKAADGMGKLARGLAGHFPEPAGTDDWFWATQLNQARAVSLGITHFRSWQPRCAGTIWWQLNDCWPVVSWAVVDGDARRKPAWYALRRGYADRLVTIQPRAAGLAVVVVNDTDQPLTDTLQLTRRSFTGAVLAAAEVAVSVPARASHTAPVPPHLATPGTASTELLVADGTAEGVDRALWFFAPDTDLALPVPDLAVSAVAAPDGYRVHVTAGALVRDLALLADRVSANATVDDMLVTLLPGESVTFAVRTTARVDPAEFTAPEVLRNANQLVTRPAAARG
ncbi:glycoside hydrolase family 2 protein [Goodfellowiella coeruleoviolacea]|uniref:beta-mannosidase n=1 Tax=Goodfellowiella coeruleoviolacea TaxID=334858 RepID=A0AAE3GJM8_9PSEU|nr:glycoside hydrolase family 2 protein [Goodfellowiella coeruleoviolacea]MCP2169420.1 beta-mannosidase (EC 3.2.1.25) [Goodfellowiella coeruleoviolacea]